MATGSRGLGVSQQDLDASRLVFVSVKDAKPKRKVAVPVPEGGTWDQFLRQVEAKLKLAAVESIYLASSGERITRLDQLQDIDELYAVEGARASTSGAAGGANGYPGGAAQHRVGVADTEITAAQSNQLAAEVDGDAKYARRQNSLQRTMKRWFPAMGQAAAGNGLPVTTKDLNPLSPVEAVRRRVRRRRRRCTDPRNLLILFALISCMGTAFFVWSRTSNGLP